MLRCAVIFLIITPIATMLGLNGTATGAASVARILSMILVVLFVVNLIWDLVAGGE